MTERLYYNDPYLREFDATVRAVARRDDRLVVTLDRTAFYPTSGGQPFDTGTLAGLPVVDVVDEEDGTIAHVIDERRASLVGERSTAIGSTVHGVIDWLRRFEHMQQHTGQHVLSAAFDKLFGVRTVSFHLGAAVSTIDLAREMTAAELGAAEQEANRVVWEDRPVSIRYATAEEAAKMPLRKEPLRGGTLRLIDVDGFDLSACGGTHVARTGAIGSIAIGSWERFKGGQRVEFLCGVRALTSFRTLRDTVTASVRLLSVLPEELPSSIERLQAEIKDQKRAAVGLHEELARFRAAELAASAEDVRLKRDTADTQVVRFVARAVDADANGLKSLAQAITANPRYVAVLVSSSRPAMVVVSRSSGVAVAANRILAALTDRFGGRGGGKPEIAQGGGLDAAADAVIEAARNALVAAGGDFL